MTRQIPPCLASVFVLILLGCSTPPPAVVSFEVEPKVLPAEGGEIRVRWQTENAEAVEVFPFGALVEGSGERTFQVEQSMAVIIEVRGTENRAVRQHHVVETEERTIPKLSLTVRDASGLAVPGATVLVAEASAMTDEAGAVEFESVAAPWTAAVQLEFQGYHLPTYVFSGLGLDSAVLTLAGRYSQDRVFMEATLTREAGGTQGASDALLMNAVGAWSMNGYVEQHGLEYDVPLQVQLNRPRDFDGLGPNARVEIIGREVSSATDGVSHLKLIGFGSSGAFPFDGEPRTVSVRPVEQRRVSIAVDGPAESSYMLFEPVVATEPGFNIGLTSPKSLPGGSAEFAMEVPRLPDDNLWMTFAAVFPKSADGSLGGPSTSAAIPLPSATKELSITLDPPPALLPDTLALRREQPLAWTNRAGSACIMSFGSFDAEYFDIHVSTDRNYFDLRSLPKGIVPTYNMWREGLWSVTCGSERSISKALELKEAFPDWKHNKLRGREASSGTQKFRLAPPGWGQ